MYKAEEQRFCGGIYVANLLILMGFYMSTKSNIFMALFLGTVKRKQAEAGRNSTLYKR